MSFDDLGEFSEDVICLSGPISGELGYLILSGKSDEEIVSVIRQYQGVYGAESYFIEILYHNDIPKQELVTSRLVQI